MPSAQKLDTHHKEFTLNLDPSSYGSFAEIGAGQEVARWFLLVGEASGTVAKTISAYVKESQRRPPLLWIERGTSAREHRTHASV